MIEATKKGLKNLLIDATNQFNTAIGSRLYFVEADKFEAYPYAVITDVAPSPGRDSVHKFETERFQITIYDNGGSSSRLGSTQQKLWDILDDAEKNLTITDYHVIECTREAPSGYQYRVDKIWYSVTQYKILLQKT